MNFSITLRSMLQQGTFLRRSTIDLPSFFLPDSVKYTALKTQEGLEDKRVFVPDCDDTGHQKVGEAQKFGYRGRR